MATDTTVATMAHMVVHTTEAIKAHTARTEATQVMVMTVLAIIIKSWRTFASELLRTNALVLKENSLLRL